LSSVFISYSHKDEDLKAQLDAHLSTLKGQGLVDAWHDRRIRAGDEFDSAISAELDKADVILLLVSSDFLNSSYVRDIELARAMERHQARKARVIPVILRHCDWHTAPFGALTAAPKDGQPILSKYWQYPDEAFLDVVNMLRAALPAVAPLVKQRRFIFKVRAPKEEEFIFRFPIANETGDSTVVKIGRSPDNDLVIQKDLTVSRHHCIATVLANSVRIEDCNSTNVPLINGVETKSGELKLNQKLKLGYTELTLMDDA
jgi:hypothetical protein